MLAVFFSAHSTILCQQYGGLIICPPCAFRKYLHHVIIPRTSAIITSSTSVELPVFILCFLTMFTSAPFPIDIITPVWTLYYQFTLYEASTHHLIILKESAFMFLFIYRVPCRYISPCLSFPQSS